MTYTVSKPTDDDRGRHYIVTHGDRTIVAPSVSTVLKVFETVASRQVRDANKPIQIAKGRYVPREQHLDRGNRVEAGVDYVLAHRSLPPAGFTGAYDSYLMKFLDWVNANLDLDAGFVRQRSVWGQLDGYDYAGTLDFEGFAIAKGDTTPIVIDWKAPMSRRTRGSMQCQKYLMQAVAYCHAKRMETGQRILPWIVSLLPNSKPHVMKVKASEYDEILDRFAGALALHHQTA